MNAGFIKQIKANIAHTKARLAELRANDPDAPTSEEEDELLDQLGMLIELLEQFEG